MRSSAFASSLFTGYASAESRPPALPCPLAPSTQLALLTLRGNDAARAIVKHLTQSSTARAGAADYELLVAEGFAIRTATRRGYRLTPRGHWQSKAVIYRLASEFNIELPRVTPARRRRGGFQPGVFSQAGNW